MRVSAGTRDESTTGWHPATLIVVLGCCLLLVFGIPSPTVPLAIGLGAMAAALISREVSFRSWLLSVAVLCLPMLLVVGIVQGLFYPGAEVRVLWELGPARLTVEGLAIAIQLWLRVAAMVALCALFALGADSARLFDGLTALRLPPSIAYVCATALGLVPLIRTRTRRVLEARACRGWDTSRWSVRLRLLPGIVTGLFTAVLIEVEQRHDVLLQRGFGTTKRPGPLQDHQDGPGQKVLRRGAPVLTMVLLVCSVAGVLPLPTASQILGGA